MHFKHSPVSESHSKHPEVLLEHDNPSPYSPGLELLPISYSPFLITPNVLKCLDSQHILVSFNSTPC